MGKLMECSEDRPSRQQIRNHLSSDFVCVLGRADIGTEDLGCLGCRRDDTCDCRDDAERKSESILGKVGWSLRHRPIVTHGPTAKISGEAADH